MRYRLRIAPDVWLQADAIDSWWRPNRRASPDLFWDVAAMGRWGQWRGSLSERTRTGREGVRRSGVRVGRPSARVDVDRALALKRAGKTLQEIAAVLKVSPATLKWALGRLKKGVAAGYPLTRRKDRAPGSAQKGPLPSL